MGLGKAGRDGGFLERIELGFGNVDGLGNVQVIEGRGGSMIVKENGKWRMEGV